MPPRFLSNPSFPGLIGEANARENQRTFPEIFQPPQEFLPQVQFPGQAPASTVPASQPIFLPGSGGDPTGKADAAAQAARDPISQAETFGGFVAQQVGNIAAMTNPVTMGMAIAAAISDPTNQNISPISRGIGAIGGIGSDSGGPDVESSPGAQTGVAGSQADAQAAENDAIGGPIGPRGGMSEADGPGNAGK